MERAALLEGIFLLAISVAGIFEGYRLIINRDPQTVLDMLGPGYYVLFISFR